MAAVRGLLASIEQMGTADNTIVNNPADPPFQAIQSIGIILLATQGFHCGPSEEIRLPMPWASGSSRFSLPFSAGCPAFLRPGWQQTLPLLCAPQFQRALSHVAEGKGKVQELGFAGKKRKSRSLEKD